MSFAVDVNILLAASDETSPNQALALEFLRKCATGGETFYLGWPTLMGYLRIATHPRVFMRPLEPEEALSNVEALLASPHARTLAEGDGFWRIYREVVQEVPARGNLVPGAHLAALLKQHGVRTLYTLDRDFRRFDFLDVRAPF